MSSLKVKPQIVLVGETEWSTDEIQTLKDLFSGRPFVEFEKSEIWSTPVLQKALKSEVIMATSLQKGPSAVLHLAQVGYDLFGTTP